MTDTVKVSVTIKPYESWFADLLMADLADLGFESFVETTDGFEGFIPAENFAEEPLPALFRDKEGDISIDWKLETIEGRNWNEEWEKNYFKPLVISDQVVVRAPFHTDYPACRFEIVIEPNNAFGTGNHETTSQMMEAMLELDFEGKKVLDMGCGTGILAILAAKLGAGDVTAIDIDPWSYLAVKENALFNNTPQVTAYQGDASILGDEMFEMALVNIQRNVIVHDMPAYASVLVPGALILFSGFFLADLPEVTAAAEAAGLKLLSHRTRNNWVVAAFGLEPGSK